MSYAEHGSRIFLTGRFDSNPLLTRIVPKKRSEARLKLFDSCTDLRAWSPNPLDNCRYFREIVESPLPHGKVVPHDVMIETLISLGAQAQNELASLRRQLKKYQSLGFSTEQKKQLRNINDYSVKNANEDEDRTLLGRSKSSDDEENATPELSETPEHSGCCSSSNYEIVSANRSKIEVQCCSDYYYDDDEKRVASSKTDSSDYVDPPESNRLQIDVETHQAIIIEKDSEIIALKNKLAAKDVELEELKDFDRNLEITLKEKEATLNNLRKNLNISQQQILAMGEQLREGMEETDKELYDSKCLVHRLKSSLAEKSKECNDHCREIEALRRQIEDTELIREERDCLVRTLEDMSDERNTLRQLNREQAMNLADQDDEINRLLGLLKLKTAECGEREMKMKRMMDDLRKDIQTKNREICRFEADRRSSTCKHVPDDVNFRKMTNLEIRKTKCALMDDLNEVNEEIRRRCADARENDSSKICDDQRRSKTTFKRDKDHTMCTNERLKTVQVFDDARRRNDKLDDDEMYEKIRSHTSGSIDKIQRLIVELEPYRQERSTLIEQINRFNETLGDPENRGHETQVRESGTQCDGPTEDFVASEMTSEVMNFEKNYVGLGERSDREKLIYRLDEEKLDEKIDEALVIHVKRSIERIEKISLSLEGAGDYISREMAEKEIQARNDEIAKLKLQVSSRAARGQGDHAGHEEHLNEIIRVKNELTTTQRSLQRTRDQLQSSDFKLKGANRRIKDLGIEIDRLTKENKGLDKTVLIINDLAIKVDEMQLRLESSQEENSRLLQRMTRANEDCANYQNKLIDLREEGMRAKEAFDRAETNMQSMMMERDNAIETLRDERETLKRRLKETDNRVSMLNEQIATLRVENKNVDALEVLINESRKLDERAQRLRANVDIMKNQLDNQRLNNVKIEDDLNSILRENETLECETRKLCDYIERNSRDDAMTEAMADEVLDTLPNKVLDHIGAIKVRLTSSKTLDSPFAIVINELERKTRDDASIIDDLRGDIDSWTKKFAEQEKAIVTLEEANADLKRQIEENLRDREKVEDEDSSKIPIDEIIAKAERLEIEIREKDVKIEALTREIAATKDECKSLSEKLLSLTNAKTELAEEMKRDKASWERKIMDMQQQYKHHRKALHDQHNVSVKRLEAQYEEDMRNNRNPFDSESWLKSLTTKEMTELHKRICKSTPCDASKITRALNDKQNQQLQDDEKLLNFDIINTKTDNHKETAIAFRFPGYIYERRKFDKPPETPVKDNTTLDLQRFNFIKQCAMERYDSSN